MFELEIKKEFITTGFHDGYETTNYYIKRKSNGEIVCKFYEGYGGIADMVLQMLNKSFK
jgi:hypothetical protein